MNAPRDFSVGAVARLAGVTVRTLHHYDEVGLLKPSGRTDAGYRRYSAADLERLQGILVYRELGFSLDEIDEVMADSWMPDRGTLTASCDNNFNVIVDIFVRGARRARCFPDLARLIKRPVCGPTGFRTRVTTLHHERVIRIPIAGRDDWEQAARELA